MSNVKLAGNVSGTGSVTIASPNTNSDRTITLPNADGTFAVADGSGNITATTFTGNLTGNVTGNVSGNLTGNVTGDVSGSSGSCTGNAATASNINTTQPNIGYSISGQNIDYGGQGGPQVQSQGGGAAMMSFHRPGAYAINFGLGTDNQLRTGGWSRGGNYVILDSGNYTSYISSPLGVGQSWQNVVGSRAIGTTYTNSTGRSIQISIAVQLGPNATGYLVIGGNQVNRGSNPFGDRSINVTQFFAIIPNGVTYAVTGFNGITFWWELR